MGSTDPRRGEVWLTSLGAGRSGERGKNRPAIVVSADALLGGAQDELVVVVPMSSSRRPSALRPRISTEAGVDADSVAVCRAVRGVARTRLLRHVGALGAEELGEVERALERVLGLDRPPRAG